MRFCSGRVWALELPRSQWALATHRSSRTPRSSRERDIQVRRTGSKRHTLDYHTDTREKSEKLFGALSSGREMICNGLEVTDRTRVKISLAPTTHTVHTVQSAHTRGVAVCVCGIYTFCNNNKTPVCRVLCGWWWSAPPDVNFRLKPAPTRDTMWKTASASRPHPQRTLHKDRTGGDLFLFTHLSHSREVSVFIYLFIYKYYKQRMNEIYAEEAQQYEVQLCSVWGCTYLTTIRIKELETD